MTTQSGMTRRALVRLVAVGLAVTTAPLVARAQSKGKGRIVVYRDATGSNSRLPIKLNGQDIGGLSWENYVAAERPPGTYTISIETDLAGVSKRRVTLAAGQTRYYLVRIKEKAVNAYMGGGGAFGGIIGGLAGAAAARQAVPDGWFEFLPGSAKAIAGYTDVSR